MIIIFSVLLVVLYIVMNMMNEKYWDKHLDISIELPQENVFEGDVADLKEIVVNNKNLPLPTLEIDFHLKKGLRFENMENSSVSDKLYKRDVFYVGIKKKIIRTLPMTCDKRGYYTLEDIGVSACNLFFNKKYFTKRKCFTDFYVYPAKVDNSKLSVLYKKIMGEIVSRQRVIEDPFEFAGIRDYTISDPMKNINWKASAKSMGLVVNVHNSTVAQKLTLIIDTYDIHSFIDEQLCEESVRIASALGDLFLAQGINLSFYTNSIDVLNNETLKLVNLQSLGVHEFRQNLSRLSFGKEEAILNVLENISDDSLVVIISKNPEISSDLNKLENDVLWIVPYSNTKPEIINTKADISYWEYQSNKL